MTYIGRKLRRKIQLVNHLKRNASEKLIHYAVKLINKLITLHILARNKVGYKVNFITIYDKP